MMMIIPGGILGIDQRFPPVYKHAQTSCPTWSLFVDVDLLL